MTRSLLRTLLALAALVAAFGLAACGGGDDEEGTTAAARRPRPRPAAGNVTEQLFAGTAADNRQNPDEGGKKGGKLTVLSAGDVDYMDPGHDVLHVRHRDHEHDAPRALRLPARQHASSRCPTSPTATRRSPRTARRSP